MELLKFAIKFVMAFCEAVSIVMEQQSSPSLFSMNAQSLYIGVLPWRIYFYPGSAPWRIYFFVFQNSGSAPLE